MLRRLYDSAATATPDHDLRVLCHAIAFLLELYGTRGVALTPPSGAGLGQTAVVVEEKDDELP